MCATLAGDSILWLAAKELMAHYGRTPTLLCAGQQWDYQQVYFRRCPDPAELLLKLDDPALIFWHAGGNFGDVWRPMQAYRCDTESGPAADDIASACHRRGN